MTFIDAQGVVQQRYSIEGFGGYWVLWDNQLDEAIHVPGRGGRDTFWYEETGNNYLNRTTTRAYENALVKEVEQRLDRTA